MNLTPAITSAIGGTPWLLNGNNSGTTPQIFGTISNADVRFFINNNEQMRLTTAGGAGAPATGMLGINRLPSQALDIAGAVQFSSALMPNGTSGTAGQILTSAGAAAPPVWVTPSAAVGSVGWLLAGNSTGTATQKLGTTSAADISVITSNTERMRILATGNVGIGVSNPGVALDINGTVRYSGAIMAGVNGAGTTGYLLTSAGGAVNTWTNPVALVANAGWALGGNNVATEQILGTTSNFDIPFYTNNTEKMRLTKTGLLGIGKVPSQALDVQGNIQFSGALLPGGNAGSAGNFLISGGGAPAGPTWGVAETLVWIPGGNNMNAPGPGEKSFGTTSPHDLPLITNNSERMRITSSGTVHVGPAGAAAAAVLDVNGTAKLGAAGTILNGIIKTTAVTSGAISVTTGSTATFSYTINGALVNASVIVNPRPALPNGVAIAWARVATANTLTIAFIYSNAGATQTSTSIPAITAFDVTLIQ